MPPKPSQAGVRARAKSSIDPAWRELDVDWNGIAGPECAHMAARELLEIAFAPEGAPGWNELRRSAARELEHRPETSRLPASDWDDSVSRDPAVAVNLLLSTGAWNDWRLRTLCNGADLRQAALAWMGSPYWLDHEPLLEDWVVAVRDLQGRLTDTDVQRIAALSPLSGVFPPIQWFERLQHEDMRKLREPAATAVLVEEDPADYPAAEPEPYPEPPAFPDARMPAPDSESLAARTTELPGPAEPVPQQPQPRRNRIPWPWIAAIVLAFVAGVFITILWKRP